MSSRSSALASKATGFPIAKLAALVAVGYTLDEITNDITRQTKAAFEPSLDYVVVKIPRWAFEKFPGVDATLGPQMKSVGEVMALGRTFPEALNKAIQSLEIGVDALDGQEPAASCQMSPRHYLRWQPPPRTDCSAFTERFAEACHWMRSQRRLAMIYGSSPRCARSVIWK